VSSVPKEDKRLKRCKEKVVRLQHENFILQEEKEDLLGQLKSKRFSEDKVDNKSLDEKLVQQNEELVTEMNFIRILSSFEKNEKVQDFNRDVRSFLGRTDTPFYSSEVSELRGAFGLASNLVHYRGFHDKTGFAVCGGFSSGKSSFINSYIAEDGIKLETGLTPMTSLPTFIDFSDKNEVILFDVNNKKKTVAADVFDKLNHDQSPNISALQKNINRVLIETKGKDDNHRSFYFIDTPGYDPAQNSSTKLDEHKSREALNQADAVIWLIGLDANGTIPKSDLSFLSGSLSNGKKLMIVLTKSDIRTSDDINSIMNRVSIDLHEAGISFEGIQSLSQHDDSSTYHLNCTLAEFMKQACSISEKPCLQLANLKFVDIFQRCINRLNQSIQGYDTLKSALKDIQISQFKNDVDDERVDAGLLEINRLIKSDHAYIDVLKLLCGELSGFFENHCHYQFKMKLEWPDSLIGKSNNLKAKISNKDMSIHRKAETKTSSRDYPFTDDKVTLTKALKEISVFHPELSTYTAKAVNKYLIKKGILILNGGRTEFSSHATSYGITTQVRKQADGREYNAILYDKNAKLFLLGLLRSL